MELFLLFFLAIEEIRLTSPVEMQRDAVITKRMIQYQPVIAVLEITWHNVGSVEQFLPTFDRTNQFRQLCRSDNFVAPTSAGSLSENQLSSCKLINLSLCDSENIMLFEIVPSCHSSSSEATRPYRSVSR